MKIFKLIFLFVSVRTSAEADLSPLRPLEGKPPPLHLIGLLLILKSSVAGPDLYQTHPKKKFKSDFWLNVHDKVIGYNFPSFFRQFLSLKIWICFFLS